MAFRLPNHIRIWLETKGRLLRRRLKRSSVRPAVLFILRGLPTAGRRSRRPGLPHCSVAPSRWQPAPFGRAGLDGQPLRPAALGGPPARVPRTLPLRPCQVSWEPVLILGLRFGRFRGSGERRWRIM